MDDLTAFVTARLDDDERYAHVLKAYSQRQSESPSAVIMETADEMTADELDFPELFEEALRWKSATPTDLTRVLREVAAKRALLAAYDDAPEFSDPWIGLDTAVRICAAVWSDHPDYRSEWAP